MSKYRRQVIETLPSGEEILHESVTAAAARDGVRDACICARCRRGTVLKDGRSYHYAAPPKRIRGCIAVAPSGETVRFPTVRAAAKANYCAPSDIYAAIQGRVKTAVGYTWRWEGGHD